jgi:2-keto-4-pentenoate hydratase/2-oxohepta-3-ene-1,7-dioic acid hydratase in catechol pathway
MRWATYLSPTDGTERVGLVHGGAIHGLRGTTTLVDLIADGPSRLRDAAALLHRQGPLEIVPEQQARLLAPIPRPPAVRDFMAFEEHVVTSYAALGQRVHPNWYEVPVFYFTNPAAIRGPHDTVTVSPGSQAFDYELELAAIIGTPGADIPVDQAGEHIAGYTVLCDWSARDLQEAEMKVGLGPAKGKDGATSIGPYLVTPDEIAHLRVGKGYRLSMTASVNGGHYSTGNWQTIHWSFEQMISFASRGTELRPGDVIGSGTVGTGCILELSRVHGGDRYPWLRPGDRVELTVDQLGTLTSTITSGHPPQPLG